MSLPIDPFCADSSARLSAWINSPAYRTAFIHSQSLLLHDFSLIAQAQTLAATAGIPSSWASPSHLADHSNFTFLCASKRTGSAEASKACLDARLDPWLSLQRNYIGSKRGSRGAAHSYDYHFTLAAPAHMASLIVDDCPSLAGATFFAKLACSFASSYGAEHAALFAQEFAAHAERSILSCMSGASGVLGALDKKAKRNAQTFLACEAELMNFASAAHAQPQMAASIARARAFCELKSKPASFDPARYKKTLSPEKRERLATIAHLTARARSDDAAAAMLIRGTPWLSEEPHALCVIFRTQHSPLANAMAACAPLTLAAIESLGSNIWIAAAQACSANACAWAADHCCRSGNDEASGSVARMLAYGAHLDGAAEPVQYALDKLALARQADIGAASSDYCDSFRLTCDRFKAELESIAFSQLLADREEHSREPAHDAASPRRSRL